jgi:hypothetical protein
MQEFDAHFDAVYFDMGVGLKRSRDGLRVYHATSHVMRKPSHSRAGHASTNDTFHANQVGFHPV